MLYDGCNYLSMLGLCEFMSLKWAFGAQSAQIARFMGPKWGPLGADMALSAPWTLLSGDIILSNAWWRHQMEKLAALLALCAGNSPVPGEFPAQRPVTRSFDVFSDLRLNKRLSKHEAGDLRCLGAHYDIIVIGDPANWCMCIWTRARHIPLPDGLGQVKLLSGQVDLGRVFLLIIFGWFSARLQYLQYFSNGDTAVLH